MHPASLEARDLSAPAKVSVFARVAAAIRKWPGLVLWAVLALMTAGLLVYSQTMSFVWDEGFHLVAAQLIKAGRTPYVDFCFPQTLLNAYFNALVMRVFGESWYVVHMFDALAVAVAIALTADYVFRRFPERGWRLPCALAVACLVGFDSVVVGFGPSAQAYGTGLFLCVLSFRVAVIAVQRRSVWAAGLAGLIAGAAAGSTLLSAPLLPVLLVWIWLCSTAGNRWAKSVCFTAASVIPFAPEIALFVKAPQQTIFNVVQYQALFRRVNWGDVGAHDFDVFTDWTVSAETLLLGLLALGGLLFIAKKSEWERSVRREFYLAGWIAAGMGAYISTAHPTFGRYFVFIIPFVAILATAGLFYAGARLLSPERPFWPVALLALIMMTSITKYIFDDRESTTWHDYEAIAKKIDEVTPSGKQFFADEHVYFLLKRTPPSGMEFSYSHKLELPPQKEALYHVRSMEGWKKDVADGRFATVETCKDDVIEKLKLEELFDKRQDFDDCSVFWKGPKR